MSEVYKHNILRTGTVPTKREMLDMEKEMTGLYVSGHPLDDYMEAKINYQEIFFDLTKNL